MTMIMGKSRERLHRVLISALLQSSIPLSELREIVHKMEHDPSFLAELADLIRPIIDQLANVHHPEYTLESLTVRDQPEELMALISDRRLSKTAVLELLKSIGFALNESALQRRTVREIIVQFCEQASITQMKKLVKILVGNEDRDPYLEGISGRRRT